MSENIQQPKPMNQPPPLVDGGQVKEVYTDSFVGGSLNYGNMSLVFATLRGDHAAVPPTNHRHVTSRLVMPMAAAVELHNSLGQILDQLEKQGMITRSSPQLNAVQ